MNTFSKCGLSCECYQNALFLRDEGILIMTDLHLGYERALQQHGMTMMHTQKDATIQRIQDILEHFRGRINLIIINGDIKEEYATINWDEREQVGRLAKLLAQYSDKTVFIKGNHDTLLPQLFEQLGLAYQAELHYGPFLFTHGHTLHKPKKETQYIIIGHEHPALTVTDGVRTEKYACFVFARYHNKILIVIPALSNLASGTDIREGQFLSPYLKGAKEMQIVATDGKECYDFGFLNDFETSS